MTIMAIVILMGLFTIYRSVYAIVGLSERRSQFVSSVTHELKTPLTNIRMYIEMLEQGIAATPEREQDCPVDLSPDVRQYADTIVDAKDCQRGLQ